MPTPTLDGLVSDINEYPATHLELAFVEVDPPGTQVNTSEIVDFKLQVTNRGALDVGNLQLIITGLNGTLVAQNIIGSPFVSSITTVPLPLVGGHGGSVVTPGAPYRFKAPSTPRSAQDLVKVTIGNWAGFLNHVLEDHSDPDPNVQAVYRDDVLAL